MGDYPPLQPVRELSSNRVAADDNPMKLMSIAMKPLCLPPFPLVTDRWSRKVQWGTGTGQRVPVPCEFCNLRNNYVVDTKVLVYNNPTAFRTEIPQGKLSSVISHTVFRSGHRISFLNRIFPMSGIIQPRRKLPVPHRLHKGQPGENAHCPKWCFLL